MTHYYEDQDQIRVRLRSGGQFRGGPLCGYGSAHAKTTQNVDNVTCQKCKDKIATYELYYRNP